MFGHDEDDDEHEHDGNEHDDHSNMISRRCTRRLERCCCTSVTYFPLVFVYGLASWAVWVMWQLGAWEGRSSKGETSKGSGAAASPWYARAAAAAVVLYGMMMWSYTTAVLTAPGSTTDEHGYSTLPPERSPGVSLLTVKANGEMRFCKKCQACKPDRAHHCSTCRRCVLKMDHHCPWLATCIGLHNAKAFVLFLVYTSSLALLCFAATAVWVWAEVVDDTTYSSYDESLMPVQFIMLCVLSGIIGLVVGLFTCWHLWLACHGQTTIECMEKTRYRSALQRRRPADEEMGFAHRGRDDDDDDEVDYPHDPPDHHFAPAQQQLGRRLTYNQMERYRAHKRHQEYLDEQDTQRLPHAFDLGTRRNLLHLLGPSPWLWALPVCNTTGDGWAWDPSPRWLAARDRIQKSRDEQKARERAAGWGSPGSDSEEVAPVVSRPPAKRPARPPTKADRVLGRDPRLYSDAQLGGRQQGVALQRLNTAGRVDVDLDSESGDETDETTDESVPLRKKLTAQPSLPLPPPTPRQASPLRARWLPEPTTGASGLLRRVGSTTTSPMGSPVATSPRESTPASVHTDDGVD